MAVILLQFDFLDKLKPIFYTFLKFSWLEKWKFIYIFSLIFYCEFITFSVIDYFPTSTNIRTLLSRIRWRSLPFCFSCGSIIVVNVQDFRLRVQGLDISTIFSTTPPKVGPGPLWDLTANSEHKLIKISKLTRIDNRGNRVTSSYNSSTTCCANFRGH